MSFRPIVPNQETKYFSNWMALYSCLCLVSYFEYWYYCNVVFSLSKVVVVVIVCCTLDNNATKLSSKKNFNPADIKPFLLHIFIELFKISIIASLI
jgi:hypothetical protein